MATSSPFKRKRSWSEWLIPLIVLTLVGGSLGWLAAGRPRGVFFTNPLSLLASAFGAQTNVLFNPLAGMSQPVARANYLATTRTLAEGKHAEAAEAFERLLLVYPGLGDWIRLHLAEAYQVLGREDKVQRHLKDILGPRVGGDSPFTVLASYRLAQSYFRGNEPIEAGRMFHEVIARDGKKDPRSEWSKGSLYYLAQLAAKDGTKANPKLAKQFRREYLLAAPTGTFALEVAHGFDSAPGTQWDWALHAAAGKAYLTSQEPVQLALALPHLQKAGASHAWPSMVEAYIRLKQPDKASEVLRSALSSHSDVVHARAALDRLLPALDKEQKLALLEPLAKLPVCTAQDYIWWQLAQVLPEQAASYYERIVTQAADSDYAPESNWLLLWPLLKNRNTAIFQDKAQAHLSRYPFSRSAPKVLFWLGKVAEARHDHDAAIRHYHQLMAHYPMDYFAFRAYGRLQELEQGQDDPGWQLLPAAASDYPADEPTLPLLTTSLWSDATFAPTLRPAADELARIGASTDLILLYDARHRPVPAGLLAWHQQSNGQRDASMRTLRTDLFDRRVPQTAISRDVWRLLYPVHFGELIETAADRQNLDPFLIQSLMREESYFNELAVSGSDARGLMQLLPSTAGDVAQWESLPGFNPLQLFVPEVNIRLGSRYLAYLYAQLDKNPMAMVGAYNGGPNAMKRWLAEFHADHPVPDPDWFIESIPYQESQQYIKKVFGTYWAYNRLYTPERFPDLEPLGSPVAAVSAASAEPPDVAPVPSNQ